MTVMINYGWVYAVIDLFIKKVVAHAAGVQVRSYRWLIALDKAAKLPMGKAQVSLSSDNRSQPCNSRIISS